MVGVATKKDFFLVSIIGIVFGGLLIPVLENVRPPFWQLNLTNAIYLIAAFFVFANFALLVAGLLGKRLPSLWEFAKYGAAGSMNAVLDVGVLNLFSIIFHVFSGPLILLFNGISISLAVTNAYFWNKLWAFKKAEGGSVFNLKEFYKFIGATVLSILGGSLIVYFLTTIVGSPTGISPEIWENISKLISIPPIVAWNFIAYKFFVFKRNY